jgi:hypothetical protein
MQISIGLALTSAVVRALAAIFAAVLRHRALRKSGHSLATGGRPRVAPPPRLMPSAPTVSSLAPLPSVAPLVVREQGQRSFARKQHIAKRRCFLSGDGAGRRGLRSVSR